MLCAQLGLEPEFDQSAAYVEGWLKALKEDNRAIFRAASEAQKAVDYIMTRAAQAGSDGRRIGAKLYRKPRGPRDLAGAFFLEGQPWSQAGLE